MCGILPEFIIGTKVGGFWDHFSRNYLNRMTISWNKFTKFRAEQLFIFARTTSWWVILLNEIVSNKLKINGITKICNDLPYQMRSNKVITGIWRVDLIFDPSLSTIGGTRATRPGCQNLDFVPYRRCCTHF